MAHTIRFRRPETKYSISRMFVSDEQSTKSQIRLLEGLGYTIIDILPPLDGQNTLPFSVEQAPAGRG